MERIIRELEVIGIEFKNNEDILTAISNKLEEKDISYADRESLFNTQIKAQIALNYRGLKKSISEIIEKEGILIALDSNANMARINLREKNHKIKDIHRSIIVTFYLDKSFVSNEFKIFKLKSWYINKLYFKNCTLNVNISVEEPEEVNLTDIAKDSLEFIKSKQDLNCVEALHYCETIAYVKSSDYVANSISGHNFKINSFEKLSDLAYFSDEELSQVFKALSNCGIQFNEELALDIINNTDTTEFILLALDVLKSEFDRLSNDAKDLALKRIKGEYITIDTDVKYRGILRGIKNFKEEIKKLEYLEKSI